MARALGRYELLRPLARGGMAEVYLARRRAAGVEKWLVVKRMRPEHGGDARFLDLFVREARLSMSLTHQNIVPVFDFGRIDDQVFLAMERVEGKDLGSSLAHSPDHTLPAVVAAFIAAECLQALDYAHNRKSPDGTPLGIVHRDVTPRNVLLSWSGEVKLTDFGIAALAGDAPSRTIGTPAYMAPEQARAEALDPRADLYAIGLVLREALTGVRPRRGDDKEATLAAARIGQLVPWTGEIDPRLVAIVDRATALDPAERYPDAHTMLAELDSFILAARAEKRGDSPARLLAAWLTNVWKEEREETAIDEAIEAEHLVSFMDDGALDILGTGTMRSMLATAMDEAPKPAEPAPAPVPEAAPAPAPAPARSRSGFYLVAALVGAAVIVGGGYVAMWGVSEKPHGTQVAAVPGDAAAVLPQVTHTPADAAPEIAVPADAALLQATGSGTGSNSKRPPRVGNPPVHLPHVGSGSGTGSALAPVPSAITYRVVINAKPWANFTIDGDTQVHQTLETVRLTPGAHVIHFTNPELGVSKDTPITVPENDDLRVVEALGQ
jgi:hypothetical protein